VARGCSRRRRRRSQHGERRWPGALWISGSRDGVHRWLRQRCCDRQRRLRRVDRGPERGTLRRGQHLPHGRAEVPERSSSGHRRALSSGVRERRPCRRRPAPKKG